MYIQHWTRVRIAKTQQAEQVEGLAFVRCWLRFDVLMPFIQVQGVPSVISTS